MSFPHGPWEGNVSDAQDTLLPIASFACKKEPFHFSPFFRHSHLLNKHHLPCPHIADSPGLYTLAGLIPAPDLCHNGRRVKRSGRTIKTLPLPE